MTPAYILLLAIAASTSATSATIWVETNDAGELPRTAQNTVGTGPLTSISGELTGDGDMYWIRIVDPASFSARTGTSKSLNEPSIGIEDPQLFWFSRNGMGLLANDDFGVANQSWLGSDPSLTAGLYLLLITGWDYDPVSIRGKIFPDQAQINVGPAGPGGNHPIIGYTGFTRSPEGFGPYNLTMTGVHFANIPEPSTDLLVLFALLGFLFRLKEDLRMRRWSASGTRRGSRRVSAELRLPRERQEVGGQAA